MIRARDLRIRRDGKVVCVVPELDIEAGERVAVVGGNGCGKSTLLRALAGLLRDFDGACEVDAPLRERVFVHQDPWLFRGTIRRNLSYGLRARGVKAAERRRLEDHWLAELGIAALAERDGARVSGGERRRTAIGRAMVLEPQVLLLDEPLADLDEGGAEVLRELLCKRREATVVMASPTDPPAGFVDRIVRLERP